MADWIDFWDSPHAIYVNARHRDIHYLRIAEDIARYVPKDGVVLDYGCGDALHADVPGAIARRIILCEAAPKLRENLKERFAGNAHISVIAPDEVEKLADHTLDLIVLHSVAQYLTREELDRLLVVFHRLLNGHGMLVVGDVIPPDVSAFTDAMALLRFGWREGFFLAALIGLVRTVFSNYWSLRSELGLTRYDRDEILAELTHVGFWASHADKNIGHNQARTTYLARVGLIEQPDL
jgi:SAM-dependent methyltransferase